MKDEPYKMSPTRLRSQTDLPEDYAKSQVLGELAEYLSFGCVILRQRQVFA